MRGFSSVAHLFGLLASLGDLGTPPPPPPLGTPPPPPKILATPLGREGRVHLVHWEDGAVLSWVVPHWNHSSLTSSTPPPRPPTPSPGRVNRHSPTRQLTYPIMALSTLPTTKLSGFTTVDQRDAAGLPASQHGVDGADDRLSQRADTDREKGKRLRHVDQQRNPDLVGFSTVSRA